MLSGGCLEVDGGRLEHLRTQRLLSVNVCRHHGNGSLCWHHRDGDALAGRLDEGEGFGGCPHRTTSDGELLSHKTHKQQQVINPENTDNLKTSALDKNLMVDLTGDFFFLTSAIHVSCVQAC